MDNVKQTIVDAAETFFADEKIAKIESAMMVELIGRDTDNLPESAGDGEEDLDDKEFYQALSLVRMKILAIAVDAQVFIPVVDLDGAIAS